MSEPPRLDRLSALLDGLAPRVEVVRPETAGLTIVGPATDGAFLHLYLVTAGQVGVGAAPGPAQTLDAPALAVFRSDIAHRLVAADAPALRGLLCARASFEGPVGPLLLGEFAEPLTLAPGESDRSLSHAIQLIAAELQTPRCGRAALLERAGDILFVGLLRYLIARPRDGGGVFSGLADPRIARALVAMHTRPEREWTLESLAAEAGMSRTAFANTFRKVTQQTPGKYLTRLRLAIARRAVQSGQGLKQAAQAAGYRNPSALSRALSRARSEPRD